MMSLTIGNTHGVNELQLKAMLTGQLKEATRLEGWEAFKNFFVKLLNHLPGMNLEDKEKNLRDIYNTIYGEKTAPTSATHSIDTLWPALERLIHLMEGDHVRAMEFELIDHKVAYMTGQVQKPGHRNLVIRVDGHTLPEIALSNSDMHHKMLSNLLTHNMISKNGVPNVYQLDPEKLVSQGRGIELASSVVKATSHGFEVAKALEASRELMKTPVQKMSNLNDQIAYLDDYQQLKAVLKQLISVQGVHAELHSKDIDDALAALDIHRQQQLESNQQINHEFVYTLGKKCADDILKGGLLSKDAINTKLSLISTLTPHIDALFHKADGQSLLLILSQLRLADQVADLQQQLQSPGTFPQEPFSNLQVAIRKAKTGPLTTLLNTAFNAIRQTSPYNINREAIKAQALQASGELLQTLEVEEANMAKLLGNADIRSEMDNKTTKKMMTQAKVLPPFTQDRTTLISRAKTVHQQNVAITKIDRLLSEGLTLVDRKVLDFNRESIILELQELNTQLPECQRKSSYQRQIDELNEGLLHREVDIWKERVRNMPETGESATSEHAVQALTALKDKVQQLNIPEQSKSEFERVIAGLITQDQGMRDVETKLRDYTDNNTYAMEEDVLNLSEKISAFDDCPRKHALMKHIEVLQTKNDELSSINKQLADVDQKIIEVDRNHATWSEELSIKFTSLQTQVEAFPDGKPKKNLLRNMDNTKTKLLRAQDQEKIFSAPGTLLAGVAVPSGDSSTLLEEVVSALEVAGNELKKLPESHRRNELATRLGIDTNNAVNLLKGSISVVPRGDKKYMAAIEKVYRKLRNFLLSKADYLPNYSELTNAVKVIKHENNFSNSTFQERFAWPSKYKSH